MHHYGSRRQAVLAALEAAGIERGHPAPRESERRQKLVILWINLEQRGCPVAWPYLLHLARTTDPKEGNP